MSVFSRSTAIAFFVMFLALSAFAQSTEFSYQGSLKDGPGPATGNYDFEFALFDAPFGGTQIGSTLSRNAVAVSTGTFAVNLDFGDQFPGAGRFLEIRVRLTGGGAFATLSPRQAVSSSPYSVQSLNSTNATTATNAVQLGGIAASQYVLTGDARLSDPRNPLPNSPNYIQNGATLQAASNFNISGTGTAGIFNAATQYNFNGSRFTGIFGSNNTYTGLGAGVALTTGASNSMFGRSVGVATTTGSNNSFFGTVAGITNITGGNNTVIGAGADLATSGLNFATAIGAGSVVSASNNVVLGRSADTVQIPGTLNVTGSFGGNGSGLTNLNAGAITTGTLNPLRLGNGAILNGTTPQAATDFNISGNGKAAIFDADTQFNIAGIRVVSVAGNLNTFVGVGAGIANSLGAGNSFFGRQAGTANTSGIQNSFFGFRAGASNTTACCNDFFGSRAGELNTTGAANAFFGGGSGTENVDGRDNSFFGSGTGRNNSSGNGNSAFGESAGAAITIGSFNTFVGSGAGTGLSIGNGNTSIGYLASFSSNSRSNATAIGFRAQATKDNSLVLGSIDGVNGATADTEVGIGTTSPLAKLDVRGSIFVGIQSVPDTFFTNALVLRNDGASSLNSFRIDAFNNGLVIAGRSQPGSPNGTLIQFRTATAGDGESARMLIDSDGTVAINVLGAAGATALCRNASNQISTCSSSSRYKTNVNPISSGLDLIRKLRPVSFNWTDGGMADMGLVAEEVNAVEPLLTTTNDKGEVEGVKYDRVGVVLVNAVKEQQAQIEAQEKRNDGQQKQIEAQQKQIEMLIKIVCGLNPDSEVCKPQ